MASEIQVFPWPNHLLCEVMVSRQTGDGYAVNPSKVISIYNRKFIFSWTHWKQLFALVYRRAIPSFSLVVLHQKIIRYKSKFEGYEIISIVKPIRCTTVSNLFYFGMTLYMFRTVFPFIIRSSRLYIQQQAFVKHTVVCLLVGTVCQRVAASKRTAVSVWQMPVAVCTVLNSWWWTERPSETCRVSFHNKINLIHWCILSVLL